jgi:hypothetical protein
MRSMRCNSCEFIDENSGGEAELAGACVQDDPLDGEAGVHEIGAHADIMGRVMFNVLPQLERCKSHVLD